MPKNFILEDIKPKNEAVNDILPKNKLAEDILPKNLMGVGENLGDQLYSMTLGVGMLIGLGFHITYNESINITSPKSP